uniref:Carbamoyl phosphate synthase small chain n=1 Tax=Leiomenia cribrosa TaxID=217483 RepID=A0A4D6WVA2_9FLOR|nr:Carbamoyl phosphate synthase small subunit [Leiomenia cribrosa]
MYNKYYPSLLMLEDGTKYYGWSLNKSIISLGEVVFNTGITGYQEIITDPSYSGQIITFTYPEIGNTGINNDDNESSDIHIKGIIAKNICSKPSNWRHKISFLQYILNNEIPHIFGIDTRSITKHIRYKGSMNGCISSKILDEKMIQNMIHELPKMEGMDLISNVTVKKAYTFKNSINVYQDYSHLNYKTNKLYGKMINIAVVDFGVKNNILLRLLNYGCNVYVLPANSTYKEILASKPDGILLSNGPGDPSIMNNAISNIRQIINSENIPIFGICMGHQILSIALGGKTFKLKFGHRGLNHPTGINQKAEITSQNHGFAVDSQSLSDKNLYVTHRNLNDLTVAGLIHKSKPFFSVQYHPEASPGPHDSDYLFYHFINLIKLAKIK